MIVWVPTASVESTKLAFPVPSSAVGPPSAVPLEQVPSTSATSPAGVATAGSTGVTVTSKVTDWLNTDGFTVEATPVEVEALFTTCETSSSLARKFVLPR